MSLINFLDTIPSADAAAIRAGTYAGDIAPVIQARLNTGGDYGFEPGVYPIKSPIRYVAFGQRVVGLDDRGTVIFEVKRDFSDVVNGAAVNYVIKMLHSGHLNDITIRCVQPSGTYIPAGQPVPAGWQGGLTVGSGADQIRQYPWLIDLTETTRGRIDNITMEKGWFGINATGNAGGCNLGRIEDGCLSTGIIVNNPLDFFTIDEWESWVYNYAGTGLEQFSYANPGDVQFLTADGLDVASIHLWHKGLVIANGSQLASTFGTIKLDGGDSHMRIEAGRTVIAALNALSDSVRTPVVKVNGGSTVVGALQLKDADLLTNATRPIVEQNGGDLFLNGGAISGSSSQQPEVVLNGGNLFMSNIRFDTSGPSWKPNGVVRQIGGRLHLHNSSFQDSAGGGYAVYLSTNEHHNVSGNFFGGRTLRRPGAPIGNYQGNTGLAEDLF
ncbi:hypothetical protein [Methylobacterium sp. WL120]|uniref:hypothetical protein n=1 Tax=Methylobacterium sp. WL120 TaxID=2603887 RepID=UPI0011CAA34A|nr:hypothetical protein [Methylobacterium sp. WL120]TXM68173.1 hypothetical protein FV229_08335 [Methylobacterium sp. WL120]